MGSKREFPKSRVTWIKLGDANTKFFHAFTKDRMSHNAIKSLTTAEGVVLQTQQLIKEEVVSFYKKLMDSAAVSLPMVDRSVVETGPVLSESHKHQLCLPVTGAEVKEALFSMDDMKAPGLDGFNVLFFKKACYQLLCHHCNSGFLLIWRASKTGKLCLGNSHS